MSKDSSFRPILSLDTHENLSDLVPGSFIKPNWIYSALKVDSTSVRTRKYREDKFHAEKESGQNDLRGRWQSRIGFVEAYNCFIVKAIPDCERPLNPFCIREHAFSTRRLLRRYASWRGQDRSAERREEKRIEVDRRLIEVYRLL